MVSERTRRAVLGTGAVEDVELSGMPDDPHTSPEDAAGAVAIPVEGDVAIGGPAMQALVQWMAERANRDDTDEWAAMERSVARILAGEDAEEVLREDTPVKGEDIAGRPFTLHGFDLTETDFQEGNPVYATLDVTFPGNARHHVVNIGGMKVLARLMMLDQLGEWPQFVMITSKQTRSGNRVHDIVRAR